MGLLGLARWFVYLSRDLRIDQHSNPDSVLQGYQMARNLQAKLAPTDSVRLFDLNKDAVQRLATEMRTSQTGGAAVEVAENVNEAARDSVCLLICLPVLQRPTELPVYSDEHVIYVPSRGRLAGSILIICVHKANQSSDAAQCTSIPPFTADP